MILLLACIAPPPPAPTVEPSPPPWEPPRTYVGPRRAEVPAPPVDLLPSRNPFAVSEARTADLLPPSLAWWPSTYDLDNNDPLPGAIRERRDGVEVFAAPLEVSVLDATLIAGDLDGLREGRRVYLPATLPSEDQEWIREKEAEWREISAKCADPEECPPPESTRMDRVIRLAAVLPRTVSAWIGTSSFTGGAAHSNNTLECATWSRRTGKRLSLADALGAAEVERRLRFVEGIYERNRAGDDEDFYTYVYALRDVGESSWRSAVEEGSFLLDGGDPVLCMRYDVGPGGQAYAVRLSAALAR